MQYKKMSKSEMPDVPHEDFWTHEQTRAKTQHFALHTTVIYNRRRYVINQYIGKVMILIDAETGEAVRVDNPCFMR